MTQSAQAAPSLPPSSMIQPLTAGVLAAVVGFASAFAIVLQGLAGVGATPAEAASGLLVLCVGQGVLAIYLSLRHRQPLSIAWSTPGAALLMGTAVPNGGFGVAVTAFMITGVLIVIAGLWRPLARLVSAIPLSLASAMLAGILMELCLAPVHAVAQLPTLALPIVLAWMLAWCLLRRYAVVIAVLVASGIVAATTAIPADALDLLSPRVIWIDPVFDLMPALGIAIPLFIVTMASQNVPGTAVLRTSGYKPPIGDVFVSTGLGSIATALLGAMASIYRPSPPPSAQAPRRGPIRSAAIWRASPRGRPISFSDPWQA